MLTRTVHGNKICLDLLSDYNSYFAAGDPGAERITSGWSAAYTVETILLQLQSATLPSSPLAIASQLLQPS